MPYGNKVGQRDFMSLLSKFFPSEKAKVCIK